MHNSFNLQQYICYTILLNMFRAARCSSSGGPIVSSQPLLSSPSVSSRTVCGWRADCSPLSTRILYGSLWRVTIPEAVVIQLVLLMMSSVLLETCWGVQCNVYIVEEKKLCTKLVFWKVFTLSHLTFRKVTGAGVQKGGWGLKAEREKGWERG